MFAFLSESPHRERLSSWIFARRPEYAPSGSITLQSLFEWEKRVISSRWFPRSGLVLVCGAGTGREMRALKALGYDVVGFDSARELVGIANGLRGGLEIICGSLEQFASSHPAFEEALDARLAGRRVAATIFGWGVLNHLLTHEERVAALLAVRRWAPSAPTLLSFMHFVNDDDQVGVGSRCRRLIRYAARCLGGKPKRSRADRLFPSAGLIHLVDERELNSLARDAGFEIAFLCQTGYWHAVLTPDSPLGLQDRS